MLSDKFKALLCDPEGEVCTDGSDGDREELKKCIFQLETAERLIKDGTKDEDKFKHDLECAHEGGHSGDVEKAAGYLSDVWLNKQILEYFK